MNKQQQERWQYLAEQAHVQIRTSGQSIRGIGQLKILWKVLITNRTKTIGYCISERAEPLNGVKYFAVISSWDSLKDIERFGILETEPEPSIDTQHAGVEAAFVDDIVETLKSSLVAVFPESNSLVIDGTSFEVLVGPCGEAKFAWTETVPTSWRILEWLVKETVNYCGKLSHT